MKKEQWVGKHKDEMLDERHLHTVFTIRPSSTPCVAEPGVLYDLLFSASAETVKDLAADPRYRGRRRASPPSSIPGAAT